MSFRVSPNTDKKNISAQKSAAEADEKRDSTSVQVGPISGAGPSAKSIMKDAAPVIKAWQGEDTRFV